MSQDKTNPKKKNKEAAPRKYTQYSSERLAVALSAAKRKMSYSDAAEVLGIGVRTSVTAVLATIVWTGIRCGDIEVVVRRQKGTA